MLIIVYLTIEFCCSSEFFVFKIREKENGKKKQKALSSEENKEREQKAVEAIKRITEDNKGFFFLPILIYIYIFFQNILLT